MNIRHLSWYVKTVGVQSDRSIASQLAGYLKGQWVYVNGMMARIVNHTGSQVVLWMKGDKMLAVFK